MSRCPIFSKKGEEMTVIIGYLVEHWEEILQIVSGVVGVAMAIALLVPGAQPEKTLQKIVDFIAKFSRKPK